MLRSNGLQFTRLHSLLNQLQKAVGPVNRSIISQEIKQVSLLSNSEDRVVGKHSPSVDCDSKSLDLLPYFNSDQK